MIVKSTKKARHCLALQSLDLVEELLSGEEQKPHDSSFLNRTSSLSLLSGGKAGISSGFDFSVVTGHMSKEG